MPLDNQQPQFGNDVKKIITHWENNIINQRLVYQIFHQFHKPRQWLSATIDQYLATNNMFLLPPPKAGKTYVDVRGGFGTVARRSKAQTLRKYMNYIMNSKGWMLSTTLTSRPGDNRNYDGVTNADHYGKSSNTENPKEFIYYVIANKTNTTKINPIVSNNLDD
jgi:hypothetical protein